MLQTLPLSLSKSNGRTQILFRQTTCSASASICYNTLKVRKIYSYSDSRKFKMPIVHHLLLSSSAPMAYHETGVSNCFHKNYLYWSVWSVMHKIFIPSPKAIKLQVFKLKNFSFRHHFLVCLRTEHIKLALGLFQSATLLLCVCFFKRLTVAGNWTLSRQYS